MRPHRGITRRALTCVRSVAPLAALILALLATPAPAATQLTVGPTTPGTVGVACFPFGTAANWPPFAGFVYRNVPPFELRRDDNIAFDLVALNDVDIGLAIDMAPAGTNGSDTPAGNFFNLVGSPDYQPTPPRGDTTAGDFELKFLVIGASTLGSAGGTDILTFPGGGLIIRFYQPSGPFLSDATCTGVLAPVSATDPSGFFVKRFYTDADGLPPYSSSDAAFMTGFRLIFNRTCNGRPATILGTQNGDLLRGTNGRDVIAAYESNDRALGLGGNDLICGSLGADVLKGGKGRDRLFGEEGRDKLRGGKGKDKLIGGPGKDDERQ